MDYKRSVYGHGRFRMEESGQSRRSLNGLDAFKVEKVFCSNVGESLLDFGVTGLRRLNSNKRCKSRVY